MERLQKYADENGYFWSCGTHHQWGWDARVWKPYFTKKGKRQVPTRIGYGNSLEEAVEMCINKPKLKFTL